MMMNQSQKIILFVLLVMFICVYPFCLTTIGSGHDGVVNPRTFEQIPGYRIGVEAVIFPPLVWLFICVICWYALREKKQAGG